MSALPWQNRQSGLAVAVGREREPEAVDDLGEAEVVDTQLILGDRDGRARVLEPVGPDRRGCRCTPLPACRCGRSSRWPERRRARTRGSGRSRSLRRTAAMPGSTDPRDLRERERTCPTSLPRSYHGASVGRQGRRPSYWLVARWRNAWPGRYDDCGDLGRWNTGRWIRVRPCERVGRHRRRRVGRDARSVHVRGGDGERLRLAVGQPADVDRRPGRVGAGAAGRRRNGVVGDRRAAVERRRSE